MLKTTSIVLALIVLSCSVSACGDKYTELCDADRFFCSPENEWPVRAKSLSTERLYELDIAYSEIAKGGHAALEKELGRRGSSTMETIISSPLTKNVDGHTLVSILYYIEVESGLDICETEYYRVIMNVREGASCGNPEAAYLRLYCSS